MYPGTAAALVPDRPAIVTAEDGESRSYAQLDERSARLATFLRSRGIVPGDTVLVVVVAEGAAPGPAPADEPVAHCRARLASFTCPRSVEFIAALPRSDAGTIVLPLLRERHGRARVGTGTR